MGITEAIRKNDHPNLVELDESGNPCVYFVNNEQKMILMLKKDLNKLAKNSHTDKPSLI